MHKFERFIIYPLLIIALFYSLAGHQITTIAEEVIDKLVVREISVVNENGNEVVSIDNSKGGGRVMTFNKDGDLGVGMQTLKTGGNIRILNKEGEQAVALFSDGKRGLVQTFHKGGTAGTNMLTDEEGGTIATLNKEGDVGTAMSTDSTYRGIWSYYENGSLATSMASAYGIAMIGTYYGNEQEGSFMLTQGKTSEITIDNKEEIRLIDLKITEDGHGSMSIYDKNGENPVFYGYDKE